MRVSRYVSRKDSLRGLRLMVDFVAFEDCGECLGYALVCESFCDTIFKLIPLAAEKDYNAK